MRQIFITLETNYCDFFYTRQMYNISFKKNCCQNAFALFDHSHHCLSFALLQCCPKFCQDAAMVKEKVMPRRDSPAWPWSRSHSSLPTAESRALLKTASTASWCSRCNLVSPQKYLDTETLAHGSGININTNKTKKKLNT